MRKQFIAAVLLLGLFLPASAQIVYPIGGTGGGSGSVTSVGSGAGLTGGPITTTGTLSLTEVIRAVTGTSDTILSTDAAKLVTYSNASSIAVSLPQATGSFAAGFGFSVQNLGAGLVTITPTTSTINGASTLTIPQNSGCDIVSDGTNWQISACNAITPLGTIAGLGTGVATALGTNVSGTGAICLASGSACSGGGSPGGSSGAFQGNISSAFGAIPNLTFDTTNGYVTNAINGAASHPAELYTGTIPTGSTSTDYPVVYLNFGGGTNPTFSTNGEAFGINVPSGYTGNIIHTSLNGSDRFVVDAAGDVSIPNGTAIKVATSNRLILTAAVSYAVTLQSSNTSGAAFPNAAATTTAPSIVNRQGDLTTGIGGGTNGTGDLIASSTDIARWSTSGLVMEAGQMVLKGYAVGSLPTGITGGEAYVTDQTAACSYGATPVGSGSNVCKVFYNGTGWVDG